MVDSFSTPYIKEREGELMTSIMNVLFRQKVDISESNCFVNCVIKGTGRVTFCHVGTERRYEET